MIINSYIFGSAYNTLTQAYLTAFPSTTIDIDSLNTLEQGLIDNILLSKMLTCYILWGSGGTEQGYNFLGDPTFNIDWGGGVTFPNGAKGNGTNGYGDTHFNPSTHGQLDDAGVYVYNATEGSQVAYDFGCYDGTNYYAFILLYGGANTRTIINSPNIGTVGNTTTKGGIAFKRTSSTTTKMLKGGTLFDTQTLNSTTKPNTEFNLFCLNNAGSRSLYSDREFRFFCHFEGMSDGDLSTLHTLVEDFQTSNGRNV